MSIGVRIVGISITLIALSLSSNRLGRDYFLFVGLHGCTFSSAAGFAFRHILIHHKSIIIIGLSSDMALDTLVGHISYVLSINTDESIWYPFILALPIIAVISLGVSIYSVFVLFVTP